MICHHRNNKTKITSLMTRQENIENVCVSFLVKFCKICDVLPNIFL